MKKNNKRVLIIVFGIVLIFTIIGGYLIYYKNNQVKLLNNEVDLVEKKDLFKDDYTVSLTTSGDYSYVEENIKNFYKDLSDKAKIIYSYLNNEDLIRILSADNIKNDGPNFKKSYQILTDAKNNLDSVIKDIDLICSDKGIKDYFDKNEINNYYYDLYLEYMDINAADASYKVSQAEVKILKEDLVVFLDKVEAILDMLKKNKNYWYIKDGVLYFKKTDLVNKYNKLYKELDGYAKEKFSIYNN